MTAFESTNQAQKEELGELLVEAKSKFRELKKWYNSDPSETVSFLRTEFGAFPLFSRDFLHWPHLKPILKAYNKFATNPETTADSQGSAVKESESVTTEPTVKKKRKRNRWGIKSEVVVAEQPDPHSKALNGEISDQPCENEGLHGHHDNTEHSLGAGKKQKKHLSRFSSTASGVSDTGTSEKENQGNQMTVKKSRWSNSSSTNAQHRLNGQGKTNGGVTMTSLISNGGTSSTLRTLQQRTFLLRLKIDRVNQRLATVSQDAKKKENDPDRSPSPEPIYNATGKRINVREYRMRSSLELEKRDMMEELVRLNPSIKPKNMKMSKLQRKLYVPTKDFPGYNFLGLIIGPRGMTQKRLEQETNTKITIRGKGSVKPGRGKAEEASHEELHILIEAEDEEDMENAVEIVGKLLAPGEENTFLEEHRQQQLQELALINGTVKKEEFCLSCGEKGHYQYECPNASLASFTMANVTCKICGEKSHVTADCPMKNKQTDQAENEEAKAIDKDYYEFMEMVGGEKAAPQQASSSTENGGGARAVSSIGGAASLSASAAGTTTTESAQNATTIVETSVIGGATGASPVDNIRTVSFVAPPAPNMAGHSLQGYTQVAQPVVYAANGAQYATVGQPGVQYYQPYQYAYQPQALESQQYATLQPQQAQQAALPVPQPQMTQLPQMPPLPPSMPPSHQ